MPKKVPLALIASLVAAVLLASCSSSKSSSTSSTPPSPAAPATAPGVTDTSILLGTTQPLTGPAAPGYSEISAAMKAYFSYLNEQGGVFGRRINLQVEDDQYNPNSTTALTQKLVLQDHIFADLAPLGTPTVLAAINFLTAEKVPAVFIASGCNCWSDPRYPYAFGWQPPYTVEGKILGDYVRKTFSGQKIGYLYQDDEFGLDGVKGLDAEIPKSQVVSRQTYTATPAALAAGLSNQITALKNAGAQVVVLYTIPAATALALLAAANLGYHPQWVVSSVGSDPNTLSTLLAAFSQGKAGSALLNGIITNDYLPPVADSTNPWVVYLKSVLKKYAPNLPWDGNTEYGVALAYTFSQVLKAAGKNLTRQSLVSTLETKAQSICNPGLTPLTYTASSHYGYQGSEILQIGDNGNSLKVLVPPEVTTISASSPITPYHGQACAAPPPVS
jgi:ABC-type branched-subunit amino acid transport system substrate-binding protein